MKPEGILIEVPEARLYALCCEKCGPVEVGENDTLTVLMCHQCNGLKFIASRSREAENYLLLKGSGGITKQ